MNDDLRSLTVEPLPSPVEMAAWDRAAIAAGVSGLELMERAGRAAAEVISGVLAAERGRRPVVVVCGPGNNGGDGLVIARVLRSNGYAVSVVAAGAPRYSNEFTANAERLQGGGEPIFVLRGGGEQFEFGGAAVERETVEALVHGAAIVVDALLGTGQTRAPEGAIRELVEVINGAAPPGALVAIDVPTGVNGGTGEVYEPHIAADFTIAIECTKRGLLQCPAREAAGRIALVSIGIGEGSPPEFRRLGPKARIFPPRPLGAHKGDFGSAAVIGGCAQMPGAPILAGRAALRVGAGWVSVAEMNGVAYQPVPEFLLAPLPFREGGALGLGDLGPLRELALESTAVIIGPGLGTRGGTRDLVCALFEAGLGAAVPTIIDADALNILAEILKGGWRGGLSRAVLTPHPGEMARLLGCDAAAVQRDRYGAARALAQRTGAAVVLKGAGTIVVGAEGGFVAANGTPFLATPGSGDVLSGIIGGLIANGYSPVEAACRGVSLHGEAGEIAHTRTGGPIIAGDIIEAIPAAMVFGEGAS